MDNEAPLIVRGPVRHQEGGNEYTVWCVRCPGCGVEAMIDKDQFYGRVSMECAFCEYHQTHDLSRS